METGATRKIAIVTGASKGIGRAISVELGRNDCYIIINYHSDENGAQKTLEKVRAAGGDGEIMGFDVSSLEETATAIKDIAQRHGRIDILVNNAGVTADGLFIMMSREKWDTVVNTNLNGFYNMTKPVLEKMIRKKTGAVVSISSASALMANRGQANYSAANAGLIAASRSIASEVARLGVRVNVVAPGLIETDMIKGAPIDNIKNLIPMARIGKPEEVASVVRFLCSNDASYVTGQVITVNGGMF
jgi:3-oxoacyl-[acyl-carrier protein] reductase